MDHIVRSLKAFAESAKALIFPSATTPPNFNFIEYPEICGASAAVAITDDLFIVASDEDNVLRVYKRGTSDAPKGFDLNSFLRPDDHPEADIEGGTRIAERAADESPASAAGARWQVTRAQKRTFIMPSRMLDIVAKIERPQRGGLHIA